MTEPLRNCSNCACSHAMKHPQLVNQEQMVCRRNGMVLASVQVMGPKGPTTQQGLMYPLTTADAVCFDGWRPIGTLPGDNAHTPLIKRAINAIFGKLGMEESCG